MKTQYNDFYGSLPLNKGSITELLLKDDLFHVVPHNWHVVITDIINSTDAVNAGKHQQVNLAATGSIVTVQNISFKYGFSIPFFFGGDGATFLVPDNLIDMIMKELAKYQSYVSDTLHLGLRTDTIPVQKIYQSGNQILIAKLSRSSIFSIPVILGSGLSYAEATIKGKEIHTDIQTHITEKPDLTGMQCRWDKIAAPDDHKEVLTLLVNARDSNNQAIIFKNILENLDKIFGPISMRQPLIISKLKLRSTFDRKFIQLPVHFAANRWGNRIQHLLTNIQNSIFFNTDEGRIYLSNIIEMADTLVMDGKINTVISGTVEQRKILLHYFDQLEHSGDIVYGMHISSASIMSCYVRNMGSGHIHFVDGADGGYTQASKTLKRKLRQFN